MSQVTQRVVTSYPEHRALRRRLVRQGIASMPVRDLNLCGGLPRFSTRRPLERGKEDPCEQRRNHPKVQQGCLGAPWCGRPTLVANSSGNFIFAISFFSELLKRASRVLCWDTDIFPGSAHPALASSRSPLRRARWFLPAFARHRPRRGGTARRAKKSTSLSNGSNVTRSGA